MHPNFISKAMAGNKSDTDKRHMSGILADLNKSLTPEGRKPQNDIFGGNQGVDIVTAVRNQLKGATKPKGPERTREQADFLNGIKLQLTAAISPYSSQKTTWPEGIKGVAKEQILKPQLEDWLATLPAKPLEFFRKLNEATKLVLIAPADHDVYTNNITNKGKSFPEVGGLERWIAVKPKNWKFALTDGRVAVNHGSNFIMDDARLVRTIEEFVYECEDDFTEKGVKIMPEEAYLPLVLRGAALENIDSVYRTLLMPGDRSQNLYLSGAWAEKEKKFTFHASEKTENTRIVHRVRPYLESPPLRMS